MKIITICNQKGGVGKTSTVITLASYLAISGKKTLIVDLDPQGNATSGVGVNKRNLELSVYHAIMDQSKIREVVKSTAVDNLCILPSNLDLTGAEVELVSEIGRESRLKKVLHSVSDEFDFVIIDCPPSLGLLTINALTAAESVLIPIQCEYYALEGLGQLIKTISLVKDNLNASLYIEGILMTMADRRTNLSDQVIQEVRTHFGDKAYDAVIPRSIKMGEAPGFGKPIMFYDKNCSACKKYDEFFSEFKVKNPNAFGDNKLQVDNSDPNVGQEEQKAAEEAQRPVNQNTESEQHQSNS